MPELIEIEPEGRWGKQPLYPAKIGTFSSTHVMVKRVRKFHVEQRIQYCELKSVQGMSTGCTPPWKTGRIWLIDGGRLFINKS
jgi:hypothetical protein